MPAANPCAAVIDTAPPSCDGAGMGDVLFFCGVLLALGLIAELYDQGR